MKDFSFVTNSHPAYIESLYQDYRKDPQAVDPEWVKFFEGFDFAVSTQNGKAGAATVAAGSSAAPVSGDQLNKELSVYRLIQAYRKKGHLISKTNPIRERKNRQANLEISFFGLSDADLKSEFFAGQVIGLGKTSLENIVNRLKQVYAGPVGLEFTYINDAKKVEWLQREMENTMHQPMPLEKKKRVLQKLNQGVIF